MNTSGVQQLKMAWLAAKEAGDMQTQLTLLREHPAEQAALLDFIAGYHATGGATPIDHTSPLLAITQRACQRALERVFDTQAALASLGELRKSRSLSKVEVAKGLRLTVDVWNKFEAGAIELASLSQRHLERLAQFFQIRVDQFSSLLTSSQPAISMDRRQSREASRHEQQGPQKQSFAEAIARSTMSKEERSYWSE